MNIRTMYNSAAVLRNAIDTETISSSDLLELRLHFKECELETAHLKMVEEELNYRGVEVNQ